MIAALAFLKLHRKFFAWCLGALVVALFGFFLGRWQANLVPRLNKKPEPAEKELVTP